MQRISFMVYIFKSPHKIGSSARIEGYFADLKSTIIDKRKPRLRIDKCIVIHLRSIRGSMKLTGSKMKTLTNHKNEKKITKERM